MCKSYALEIKRPENMMAISLELEYITLMNQNQKWIQLYLKYVNCEL